MDFGRAIGIAFTTGGNRKFKDDEVDETEQVGWGYGILGVLILIAVQSALIVWGVREGLDPSIVRNVVISSFTALIIPFILFWLVALATRTTGRLPAAFLFIGLALAVLQLVSAVLSSFGTGQSGFIIGLLFAVMFLAARGFLKLGWFPAIMIGLFVVAGFIGAGYILLNLPTGRLLA